MMANDCFQQLATLIKQREEKRYAWLRHLLLLASGSLSILVSLRAGTQTVGFPHYCFATALASLGLGILLGAISLYGEVRTAHDLVKRMSEEGLRRLQNPGTPDELISSQLPTGYAFAETFCYLSLIVSAISLVVYAIIVS
jgi:hypothetical protein